MSSSISDTSGRSSPRWKRPVRPRSVRSAVAARPLRSGFRTLRRSGRAPFDDPALVGAHVREIGGVEGAQFDELAREPLHAADGPVGVNDLDPLPAVTLVRLEDRTDLDLDTGLLANFARESVFEPLASRKEYSEDAPLRRAAAMACQDHLTVGIDPEADDAHKEPRLGAVEDTPLPPDGKGVIEKGESTEEHAETLRPSYRHRPYSMCLRHG